MNTKLINKNNNSNKSLIKPIVNEMLDAANRKAKWYSQFRKQFGSFKIM